MPEPAERARDAPRVPAPVPVSPLSPARPIAIRPRPARPRRCAVIMTLHAGDDPALWRVAVDSVLAQRVAAARVEIQSVVEEESTGNGALMTFLKGHTADAVLIPEPEEEMLVRANVGTLWFEIEVRGKPVHVLSAPAGTNAIEKSFPVIQALRDLEAEMNVENVPAAYAGLNHPLNLNIGIFAAGDWPSTVPAQAEIHGRMSYFPGTAFAEVAARIEATVAEAAAGDDWLREYPPEVSFYGFRSDGHTVSAEQPVLQTLADCHQRLTGEPPAEYISTCTTDLRAFHHFGRARGTCYGPVSESIHGVDERVRIDSVMQTAKAYALFLSEWCGLSE